MKLPRELAKVPDWAWLAALGAVVLYAMTRGKRNTGTIPLKIPPPGEYGFAPGNCDPSARGGCPPEGFPGYKPWDGKTNAAEIGPWARELLALPLGEETERYIGGVVYKSREECHFHPCGGPVKPWGIHKGTTIYQPIT